MLHKTRGIVINYVRYRDTSIIAKIYTEKFGVQTYIENGVRSSKSKNKIALFQPLTLLDLVVYHDEKKEVHRLKEIKCSYPYQSLPYTVEKSSIALFLNELLSKTLNEQIENPALFDFLYYSFLLLDEQKSGFENFHLQFLIKLASFLGFAPETADEIEKQFNEFSIPIHLDDSLQRLINQLIASNYNEAIPMNRSRRNQLLDTFLMFYRLHVDGLIEIKSLGILREVLG